jgi:hypothetical protein
MTWRHVIIVLKAAPLDPGTDFVVSLRWTWRLPLDNSTCFGDANMGLYTFCVGVNAVLMFQVVLQ